MRAMTPHELLVIAQEIVEREPNAQLVKNAVGNLAILDAEEGFIGWADLQTGEVEWLEIPLRGV